MNTKKQDSYTNPNSAQEAAPRLSRRGFASMDPEVRRRIAREGGKAAHASGHAHEFNSEEAREAGRRGGRARWHLNAVEPKQDETQKQEPSFSIERESA